MIKITVQFLEDTAWVEDESRQTFGMLRTNILSIHKGDMMTFKASDGEEDEIDHCLLNGRWVASPISSLEELKNIEESIIVKRID